MAFERERPGAPVQVIPEALGAAGGPRAAEEEDLATWAPIDLSETLWSPQTPLEPTLLTRSDGVSLLYPGLVHSLHGESESGKSLIMQAEAGRLLIADESVLYLDFESDPASVVERLRRMGVADISIMKNFHYVRPESAPYTVPERSAWRALLDGSYALVVIDGVTDALTMFGHATKDNDGIAVWLRDVPRKLADRTGAAVVLIDHVTKEGATRGRFAIGGQAKMAGLTGAAYLVEPVEPLGIGMTGIVTLRIAKDRPGRVRSHCGIFRKHDRTQEAARLNVDSRGEQTIVSVQPPSSHGGEPTMFRPTTFMERISRVVEANPGLSQNLISGQVQGRKKEVICALNVLITEGFVSVQPGANRSQLHNSIKRYRQANDPVSDRYEGTDSPGVVTSESVSPR